MQSNESQEMYLKAIYSQIRVFENSLRAKHICEYLNYSRASVSRGLKLLQDDKLITISNNIISLTQEGQILAEKLFETQDCLLKLFDKIGVDPKVALHDACKMEHVISPETINSIKKYLESN